MGQKQFWFYIKREMTDFIQDVNLFSGLDDSHRDYEDTWEWYEYGSSDRNNTEVYINISREHNGEQASYECPVRLKYYNSEVEIHTVGLGISIELGVKVYYGQVAYKGGNQYIYQEELSWGA